MIVLLQVSDNVGKWSFDIS